MNAETKELRRRCVALVAALDLPADCDTDAVLAAVSRQRDKSIVLHPMPGLSQPGSPCGVWLDTPDADHVFYETQTSGLHQSMIVLHELGHVISNHPAQEGDFTYLTTRLLPGLDPSMVSRVLTRGGYAAGTPEEDQAETIGTLLLERISRSERAAPPATPQLDALSRALGGQ